MYKLTELCIFSLMIIKAFTSSVEFCIEFNPLITVTENFLKMFNSEITDKICTSGWLSHSPRLGKTHACTKKEKTLIP